MTMWPRRLRSLFIAVPRSHAVVMYTGKATSGSGRAVPIAVVAVAAAALSHDRRRRACCQQAAGRGAGGGALRPIVVDTDAGHDDIAALVLLAAKGLHPCLVTVSHGMQPVGRGAAWVRLTLHALGLSHIPVVPGRPGPLGVAAPWQPRRIEDFWPPCQEVLGKVYAAMRLSVDRLEEVAQSTSSGRAGEPEGDDAAAFALLAEARRHGSIEVLAMGSMTNVARAWELDADTFARSVSRIVFIGDTGNPIAVNVMFDPQAFNTIVSSGAEVYMIGARAYPHYQFPYGNHHSKVGPNPAWLTSELWQDFVGCGHISDLLHRLAMADCSTVLYDPLAVAFLFDRGMFDFERVTISIGPDGSVWRANNELDARPQTCGGGDVFEAQRLDSAAYRDFIRSAMAD